MGGSFVRGVVCPMKNKGKVLIYDFNKIPSPIFHWVQAAPTRDRSHCV